MPGLTARRSMAWLLTMAVPLGAFSAPLVHAHVEGHERDSHQRLGAVHAHFSSHERTADDHGRPAARDDDHDRVIYLKAYVAERTSPSDVFTVPSARLDLRAPGERCAHPAVVVTHGHDPPLGFALVSRPPPSLPVLI